MNLSEAEPGAVAVAIALMIIGVVNLAMGLVFGYSKYPSFVVGYRDFSSFQLSLLFGGSVLIGRSIAGLYPVLIVFIPHGVFVFMAGTALPPVIIFFRDIFVWFPWCSTPRRYQRAVRAGVPRHDPVAMGEFKALPVAEQRRLAQERRQSGRGGSWRGDAS
ncbi:MAG: hypothetical protein Q4E05_08530 [Pseudoclavibacter sp.]|nr:hypothetical protein [Pseudoclavibacter sp.]